MKKLFLLMMLLFFPVFSSAIDVSSCGELAVVGGSYVLTADITDSTAKSCFNISSSGITFDGGNHIIDGLAGSETWAMRINATDVVVKNFVISDWESLLQINTRSNKIINITLVGGMNYGIEFQEVNHSIIENIVGYNNEFVVEGDIGRNLTIRNITAYNNHQDGVFLQRIGNSTIYNIDSHHNKRYGISLSGDYQVDVLVQGNTITNCSSYFNNNSGLRLNWADNNTIYNNKFYNNTLSGVDLSNSGLDIKNLFYNNIFNNSKNFKKGSTNEYGNNWSITNTTGIRIITTSPSIGGNYWTHPNASGFSDTCTDTNADAYCDEVYNVSSGQATNGQAWKNADYLAMTGAGPSTPGGSSTTNSSISLEEPLVTAAGFLPLIIIAIMLSVVLILFTSGINNQEAMSQIKDLPQTTLIIISICVLIGIGIIILSTIGGYL